MLVKTIDLDLYPNIKAGLIAHADFVGQDNHHHKNKNPYYRLIRKDTVINLRKLIKIDGDIRTAEEQIKMHNEHEKLEAITCDFFYFHVKRIGNDG